MIHTQFNLPIKALRTDHGGEYTSTAFSTYLLHHRIHHFFPHNPEQNGVAERKNRHLLQTARTLLHHASLPPPFWLETTSTAVYLINCLPTKTLNMQSPYYKLYHQSPSYHHLKTFRCLCYPWIAYTRHNKLDPKYSPCIFLGYSSNNKDFRCFDPATSKIIISRHVRFHEKHEFPMAKQPTIYPPYITLYHHSSPPHSTHHPQPPLHHPTDHPPQLQHPSPHLPTRPRPTFNTNVAVLTPPPFHPPHYPLYSPYPRHPPHLHKPPALPPPTP